MNNDPLFDSKTKPVPRLRSDLDIIPINENGDAYLYFRDMQGYAPPNFALDRSVAPFLSLFDGRQSIQDLNGRLGNGTTTDDVLQFVRFLDENLLLYSPYFKSRAEEVETQYEGASVHEAITAGSSYPANPKELKAYLDDAFQNYGQAQEPASDDIKALYAPHIDPRVGMKTYVESFARLRHLKPKRVVILATSHYAGLHHKIYQNKPFIVSKKDFAMPMGTVPADRDAIAALLNSPEATGLTNHDRAHRIEHSIELHLLFLQYIWQHNFSIVPIIVSSFDDLFYMEDGLRGDQIENFSSLLREQFAEDNDTFFSISGDLAHVGKKFGDPQPANDIKDEVAVFDEHFLSAGKKNSPGDMLQLLSKEQDPYRICGFPPLYAFLKTFPKLKGSVISYDRWDETERKSAVTFGSILYQ